MIYFYCVKIDVEKIQTVISISEMFHERDVHGLFDTESLDSESLD